jgi:hypothetical protein
MYEEKNKNPKRVIFTPLSKKTYVIKGKTKLLITQI